MRFSKWHPILFSLILLFSCYGCSSDDKTNSTCDILSFSFLAANNKVLMEDVNGTIEGNKITLETPETVSVRSLIANFKINGQTVRVNNQLQESGKTANDFSAPVTYTVVAEDSTTKDYIVTVINPDKYISYFAFEKSKNPALLSNAIGVITGSGTKKVIVISVPKSTNRKALIPTFTAKAGKVTVNGVTQVSGETANDFTGYVEYLVTATNGSTTKYTVNVLEAEPEVISFSFQKSNNPNIANDLKFEIDNENRTITALMKKWIPQPNPDKFIPNFALTEGTILSANGVTIESGVTSLSFKKETVYTLKTTSGEVVAEYKVRLHCPQITSTLPIMRFSTQLEYITSKNNYTKTKLEIIGNGITEGLWSYDKEDVEIRLRGNSTMVLPKKPFRVKFPDKISLLGLNHTNEKNWVLLANDADKTLLRNSVAFSVSRTLLQRENPTDYHHPKAVLYTPATLHVDVYVGDEYQGVYHLTDQVQRNPGRIDLQKPGNVEGSNDLTGGYLMEIDGFADSEFANFRTSKGLKITLKYPDMEDDYKDQSAMKKDIRYRYISSYVQEAENALFGSDYQNEATGWRKYFDQSTLIDYYLISEFCGNSDAWWSTYMYKLRDSDSKQLFFGPVWDFDIAFDNDTRISNPVNSLMLNVAHEPKTWLTQFFKDPATKTAVKNRWNQMKERLRTNALETITKDAEKIRISREANFTKWKIGDQGLGHGKPGPANYERGIEQLRNYVNNRYTYLDGVFNGW